MTGIGPRDDQRLAIARSFGVDLPIDVSQDDAVTALQRETGGQLADVVVDVTAKAPSAFADAVALARPGGTVVVAGTRGGGGAPGFEPDTLVYKELHISGALGVEYPAYRAALEILARAAGRSTGSQENQPDSLVSRRCSVRLQMKMPNRVRPCTTSSCPRPHSMRSFNRERSRDEDGTRTDARP